MIVILGPSGCGKTTLVKEVLQNHPKDYKRVVTYTTRPKRPGERDGVDYHFVSEWKFGLMADRDEFVETETYRGYRYGTALKDCRESNSHIAVMTPSGLRSLKRAGFHPLSILIDVDRRSQLMNLLQRGDDVDLAYETSLADAGRFAGVDNEVDAVIQNIGFHMNPYEVLMVFERIVEESKEVLDENH